MLKDILKTYVDAFSNVSGGLSAVALCLAVFLFVAPGGLFGADLESFENARLVSNRYDDGDSFQVAVEGRTIHARLYFVDCPETAVGSLADRTGRGMRVGRPPAP